MIGYKTLRGTMDAQLIINYGFGESQENHLCGKIICPFHLKFDCRKLAQLNKMFIKLWIVKASELKRNRNLCYIMDTELHTHTKTHGIISV